MPGRSKNTNEYRYTFNGKERDKEWGMLDYGFRIYNPQLGKFLSVDPIAPNFPWSSPFAYAEGDVIRSIDLDGLEKVTITSAETASGQIPIFKVTNYVEVSKYKPNGLTDAPTIQLHVPNASGVIVDDQFTPAVEKRKKMVNRQRYLTDNADAINKAKQDFLSSRNLIGAMYQISPLADVVAIGKESAQGNYGTALAIAFFAAIPGDLDEVAVREIAGGQGNLTRTGNKMEGNLTTPKTDVIFDAEFVVSDAGKTLDLSKLGIYNVNNFGSKKAQNQVQPRDFIAVRNEVLDIAGKDGFTKVNFNFKRTRPDGSPLPDSGPRSLNYIHSDGKWKQAPKKTE